MQLKEWFHMQKQLDQYIKKQQGLEAAPLFDQKVVALLVELGELANETRCFKFWSKKGPSKKEVILEEFVDGVHFILSLGIELGYDNEFIELNVERSSDEPTQLFLQAYEKIQHFSRTKSFIDFEKLLTHYFVLGKALGFSVEDVQNAYIEKNKENYVRQDTGY